MTWMRRRVSATAARLLAALAVGAAASIAIQMGPKMPGSIAARRAASALIILAAVLLSSCGSGGSSGTTSTVGRVRSPVPIRHLPPAPELRTRAPRASGVRWQTIAWVRGYPAVWFAQREGVTLMRIDQRYAHLHLHAGSSDGGPEGWRFGDKIEPFERASLIAAFNGAFRLSYKDTGFAAGGHVADPLKHGLASVVTYTNGISDIGAWGVNVPQRGFTVYSVLQNQTLLVDGGAPAANISGCVVSCWGATIGGETVARSSLGIDARGELIWAASAAAVPAQLAHAQIAAGAQRALELDINPDWVAGYLYLHPTPIPAAVPLVPGQYGIAGEFLVPYTRDFFALAAS